MKEKKKIEELLTIEGHQEEIKTKCSTTNLLEWPKPRAQATTNADRMGVTGILLHCWWNAKWWCDFGRQLGGFL